MVGSRDLFQTEKTMTVMCPFDKAEQLKSCHTRSSWADFNHGLVVCPLGCQGCQKIQENVLQINLLS